jgi:hypothetical protein
MSRLSSYRAVNTCRLRYPNKPVNAVEWNNRCFLGPHTKQINTLFGQNVEFVDVKRGDTYSKEPLPIVAASI